MRCIFREPMSRLRRIEQQDRIFFVTFNLASGLSTLSEKERNLLSVSLAETRSARNFLLLGYVVMPDHVHALLAIIDGSLSDTMHAWKCSYARSIQTARSKRGAIWQARYFDFICRRTRDVTNKLDYIHQNPVVAGLVSRPEDWRWSSAAFYSRTGTPLLVPDAMDFSGDPDGLLWPAPWGRR
jgi:putative transposase